MLNDPRDRPFLQLLALLTVLMPGSAAIVFMRAEIPAWLAAAHLVLFAWFMGPFVLMLHNLAHRPAFTARWRWLMPYAQWVLGPFFGQTPGTYVAHHMGMHHPENNLAADLSSTMPYRRDSLADFGRYYVRFLTLGWIELLAYLHARRRRKLLRQALVGELAWFALVAVALAVKPGAALVVLVIPFFAARFAMMAGNWAQHAFVDASEPGNPYRNSIVSINTSYNRRCFNDGYHVGHHLKPSRHWTEMPADFEANRAEYEREGAIVFDGIDYFQIWALLMAGRFDLLAARCRPIREARTAEEIARVLRERVQALPGRANARAPVAASV